MMGEIGSGFKEGLENSCLKKKIEGKKRKMGLQKVVMIEEKKEMIAIKDESLMCHCHQIGLNS